jgi:hypothetical protein
MRRPQQSPATHKAACAVFSKVVALEERSRTRSLIKMQAGHNSQAEPAAWNNSSKKFAAKQFRKWSSYLNNDTGK